MKIFLTLALVFAAACGDDGSPTNMPIDAAPDAPGFVEPPCFMGTPVTHEEIINACTTAQKIYKTSKPPLLKPDGTLPPLP